MAFSLKTVAILFGLTGLLPSLANCVGQEEFDYNSPQTWYSDTGGPFMVLDGAAFVLQSDGNLVIASLPVQGDIDIVWDSGTTGHNCANQNCFAEWQGNGDFVLVRLASGAGPSVDADGANSTKAGATRWRTTPPIPRATQDTRLQPTVSCSRAETRTLLFLPTIA